MNISIFAILAAWLLTSVIVSAGAQSDSGDEFIKAVIAGDVPTIKRLLAANPAVIHSTDKDGASSILKAVYYRKKDVLDVLLATGVELDIFEASAVGRSDRVKELLKNDVSLANSYAADGFYPLGLAAFFGHTEAAGLLLDFGARVDMASRNPMKVMPLHAAAAARQIEIARILIEHGADVNARQQEGLTPLQEAAATGQVELVRLLLDRGAEVNLRSANGKTALRYAIEADQRDAATLLSSRGAVQ